MSSSWWRVKGSVFWILGVLFLLAGIFGIAVGVSYYFGYPYYEPGNLVLLGALCTPTAIIPGLLFIFLGRKANLREKHLVEFSAWVKAYRRIGLDELAQKLGKSPYDSEKILIEVVDRGLVRGFVDRTTNEFVLQDAVGQEQFLERCPHCNANLQQRFFLGETVRCPYCLSVIVGPAPRARKAPARGQATEEGKPDEENHE